MAVGANVKFYISETILTVGRATDQALAALAFQVEAQTKANIQANGQIDTGFMLNSTHTLTKAAGDTYGQARASAVARNPKARMAPKRSVGSAAAAVVVGAIYAIFQEEKQSFLFKAARMVNSQAKGILEPVYKRFI